MGVMCYFLAWSSDFWSHICSSEGIVWQIAPCETTASYRVGFRGAGGWIYFPVFMLAVALCLSYRYKSGINPLSNSKDVSCNVRLFLWLWSNDPANTVKLRSDVFGSFFSLLFVQWAAALSSLPDCPSQWLWLPLRPPVLATSLWWELTTSVLPAGALWEQYVCVCESVCARVWAYFIVPEWQTAVHLLSTRHWHTLIYKRQTYGEWCCCVNVHPGSL